MRWVRALLAAAAIYYGVRDGIDRAGARLAGIR
jgi:hypothetical protein